MRTTTSMLLVASLVAVTITTALPSVSQATPPPAPLRVVATVEDLGAIAREIGGDRVRVIQLVRGTLDPHFVAPTPALMTRVNVADLFIEMGFSLELWAERVLDGARNPKVRRGQPGHVYAAAGCPVLDAPARLSRAEGDVHPEGSPHVNLNPLNLKVIAANVAAGLERVSPTDADYFRQRLADFEKRIDEALYGEELVRLLGARVVARRRWRPGDSASLDDKGGRFYCKADGPPVGSKQH